MIALLLYIASKHLLGAACCLVVGHVLEYVHIYLLYNVKLNIMNLHLI